MSGPTKPELAVNQHGATVADALNGFIGHAADGLTHDVRLDIATAYFNVGGYSLIADSLDKLANVRMLIGAEPGPPECRTRALGSEPVNARRAELRRVGDLLASHTEALAVDRDLLGFTHEADAAARRLVEWLRSDRVQVRRLEDRFLHGKAFLVSTSSHGVLSGSSNLTRAGLSTNLELTSATTHRTPSMRSADGSTNCGTRPSNTTSPRCSSRASSRTLPSSSTCGCCGSATRPTSPPRTRQPCRARPSS